mmetsp:Transcript_15787/g.40828  ORF Transcript_15787/g.40828 Transcript_15787/m.40828 type:complete len:254 (+) Transcript_15787:109-870(+)|eukprot:CAMPEP_0182927724 /NCGR_PEP_ID=MMETSP0105_2-20130417/13999_1 /TAXON_ID=81532 ORGANISM="Acanthoeca-like sp., Strain 10tr" /NCGR_SAMPLE_ID=MMETSP0105_2 /ASSEMBLY_ACC=CAM_ASM_000205 /LENGTH=253 /DNA_ID=CAMNT_0025065685 /DNA_START=79 /DNA_END=840 /DNA_ORIENTATION=-
MGCGGSKQLKQELEKKNERISLLLDDAHHTRKELDVTKKELALLKQQVTGEDGEQGGVATPTVVTKEAKVRNPNAFAAPKEQDDAFKMLVEARSKNLGMPENDRSYIEDDEEGEVETSGQDNVKPAAKKEGEAAVPVPTTRTPASEVSTDAGGTTATVAEEGTEGAVGESKVATTAPTTPIGTLGCIDGPAVGGAGVHGASPEPQEGGAVQAAAPPGPATAGQANTEATLVDAAIVDRAAKGTDGGNTTATGE